MSRLILGDCVQVMAGFPEKAVDFILTDPPYLVGFRDRSGRTIAGDVNDDWLQPASNEMYRLEIFRQSSSPDGKARYQPATAD